MYLIGALGIYLFSYFFWFRRKEEGKGSFSRAASQCAALKRMQLVMHSESLCSMGRGSAGTIWLHVSSSQPCLCVIPQLSGQQQAVSPLLYGLLCAPVVSCLCVCMCFLFWNRIKGSFSVFYHGITQKSTAELLFTFLCKIKINKGNLKKNHLHSAIMLKVSVLRLRLGKALDSDSVTIFIMLELGAHAICSSEMTTCCSRGMCEIAD